MKNKLIISLMLIIIFGFLLGLVLFIEIPRLGYTYDETTNSYIITHCYGNAKEYDIPSTYKDKPISGIAREVFRDKTKLEKIDLSKTSITKIDIATFSGCTNLAEITFPSSLKYIANNAFFRCSSLEKVDLTSTNLTILAGSVFFSCTNLKYVYLPDSLEKIGSYAFYDTAIVELSLPKTVRLLDDNALAGVDAANIIYRSNL